MLLNSFVFSGDPPDSLFLGIPSYTLGVSVTTVALSGLKWTQPQLLKSWNSHQALLRVMTLHNRLAPVTLWSTQVAVLSLRVVFRDVRNGTQGFVQIKQVPH